MSTSMGNSFTITRSYIPFSIAILKIYSGMIWDLMSWSFDKRTLLKFLQTTLSNDCSGTRAEFHLQSVLSSSAILSRKRPPSGICCLISPHSEFLSTSMQSFNILSSVFHWLINEIAEGCLLKGYLPDTTTAANSFVPSADPHWFVNYVIRSETLFEHAQ